MSILSRKKTEQVKKEEKLDATRTIETSPDQAHNAIAVPTDAPPEGGYGWQDLTKRRHMLYGLTVEQGRLFRSGKHEWLHLGRSCGNILPRPNHYNLLTTTVLRRIPKPLPCHRLLSRCNSPRFRLHRGPAIRRGYAHISSMHYHDQTIRQSLRNERRHSLHFGRLHRRFLRNADLASILDPRISSWAWDRINLHPSNRGAAASLLPNWFSMLMTGSYFEVLSQSFQAFSDSGVRRFSFLKPFANANCKAPSPASTTCGVFSMTSLATDTG